MKKAGLATGGLQKAFPPDLPRRTGKQIGRQGESLLACMTANREPSNQSFEIDREATVCTASRRFLLIHLRLVSGTTCPTTWGTSCRFH
jgi:hypothetical protein